MHIFIAGATGTAGHALVPLLLEHGHTVTGTTRTPEKAKRLEQQGARAALMDGLDRESVKRAVQDAQPDVIVHQMTSLAGMQMKNFDREFAVTNRLRTVGTEYLLAAAGDAKFIAQSFTGWPYARSGGPVKSEEDPLDSEPPKGIVATLDAIKRLEALTTQAGGIILRYGGFYGPGSGLTTKGDQADMVRARKFPVVGSGDGVWSFIHTSDMATATLAAIEHGRPGEIYNVVDDEPAPVKVWLPYLAKTLGAPQPRHVPAWLGRLVAGPVAVMMMTSQRGASNAKAKRQLGWTPSYPSWREGFTALS
jgi:2-alkyl-3-oxoalkanoate reductase